MRTSDTLIVSSTSLTIDTPRNQEMDDAPDLLVAGVEQLELDRLVAAGVPADRFREDRLAGEVTVGRGRLQLAGRVADRDAKVLGPLSLS